MLFKNPVRTSKRTPYFTITTINWLTLFKFKDGLVEVENMPHARGSTSGNQVNAEQIDCFIRDNRRITFRELAKIVGTSVETIIHEALNFGKNSARWVPDSN
jgi:hypothetical protein